MRLRAVMPFHVLWRPRREAHLICSHDWMPAADHPVAFSCKASCVSELGMDAQVVLDNVWLLWSVFLTVWSDTHTHTGILLEGIVKGFGSVPPVLSHIKD